MIIGRRKVAMRAWRALGVSTILAVFGLFMVAVSPAVAQPVQITLLHINDTHSHLAAWGPKDANLDGTLGGLPKVAAIVAAERASDPKALFVHAGDLMEGDFFFNEYLGVPEFKLLKSIGLDALILGNHEFRFGPDFLVSVLQDAWSDGGAVPILGSNLVLNGHALGSWVSRTLVKDVNGVKVGLLGLTTHKGALANPQPVVILKATTALVQGAVDELREEGAQVVICLSHYGLSFMSDVAQNVLGIDVIVNAHDHAILEQPAQIEHPGYGTTFIVSAGDHYRWVGRLRLMVDGDNVDLVDYALLSADAETPPSPDVQATIETLKAGIVARYGDVYHRQLAWAEQDLTIDWDLRHAKRDTPLGNLITDAYRNWTGTDIAIEPLAYLGDGLPEGAVVGADVFRSMSYGDLDDISGQKVVMPWHLVTFRTSGDALINVLETLVALGGDYFPQVSGMRFNYDSRAPAGQKILLDTIHVNGHKFQPGQLYSITVTEGISKALQGVLGLPMQDILVLPVPAFDASSYFISLRGQLGLATSNRIRDVAAIPRTKGTSVEGHTMFSLRKR